jgi:hypothetical protein
MHMLGALRLILICLMAAAVPLQGLAAARRIGCGPGHQAPALAAEVRVHAGDAEAGDEHAHGAEAAQAQQAGDYASDAGRSAKTSERDARAAPASCSSCAPCCAAAAPGSQFPVVPEIHPSSAAPAHAVGQGTGVAAGLPFKPPRQFLA